MYLVGLIGILLALIFLIYSISKGLSVLIAAPIATVIVLLFHQLPILDYMLGSESSYVIELGTFVYKNFAIFMLGSILAKLMSESRATISIADALLNLIGTDKPYQAMLAIYAIGLFLTLGGVSVFVIMFSIIPLTRPIFERLNIPWRLVAIPIFSGTSTLSMTMLPGSPSIQNAIPSNILGTPLTSAATTGIFASLVSFIFTLTYMRFRLNQALKAGEGFDPKYSESNHFNEREENLKQPNLVQALIPIILLLGLIILFSSVNNILVIALIVAIIGALIVFRSYLADPVGSLNDGASQSLPTLVSTSSTIAFGTVTTSMPTFLNIFSFLLKIPASPLISLSLATALISLITGSASGAAGISAESFAPVYLEMGLNPEIIHRITTIAAGSFANMPFTGVVLLFMQLGGFRFKDNLIDIFVSVNVAHWLALVFAIPFSYLVA